MPEENYEKRFLKLQKNGLWLSEEETEILKKYGISYEKCRQLTEILYQIDRILEEEEIPELELVAINLSERNYYQNTKK